MFNEQIPLSKKNKKLLFALPSTVFMLRVCTHQKWKKAVHSLQKFFFKRNNDRTTIARICFECSYIETNFATIVENKAAQFENQTSTNFPAFNQKSF